MNHIHQAFELAYLGKTKALRDMIASGLDPNTRHESGHTLLQAACQENRLETVAMLLECGADPNLEFTLRDLFADRCIYRDATAISSAESVDVAALLIEYGAEIDHLDGDGWTPVVHAATSMNIDLVKLFIQKGARYPTIPRQDKGKTLLVMVKEKQRQVKSALGKSLTAQQQELMSRYDTMISLLETWEAKDQASSSALANPDGLQ